MHHDTRSKISVLRPLLIALVVSAHVPWTLYNPISKQIEFTIWNVLRLTLTAVMSPIGMPLLSVISGFLVVSSFKKYGFYELLKKKVARIIVPMIVWNFAFATLIYWAQSHGWESRPDLPIFKGGTWAWLNALLAIDTIPANGPLYFLRELFICFLLVPVFIKLAEYKNLSYIALMVSAVVIISDFQLPFIFRFDIYAWFFFGIFASAYRFDNWKPREMFRSVILVAGAASVFFVALWYFVNRASFTYIGNTFTLFGPFYFWLLADLIHDMKIGSVLKAYSKYSFTVFLTHAYIISCCWQIWSINVGTSPFYNFVIFGIFCTITVFMIAPVFYQMFYWWLRQAGFSTARRSSNAIDNPSVATNNEKAIPVAGA
ncbi:acyltransferase family protein [Brucella pituitosa]|uniref:Acyltransferase n=1 Tax=Brucella pituitosa TaxID=571256 RepID=A0ABS3K2X2_9HYPH|nr:acyltransferase [Brucella pituitosa]MBO1040398.1 acyltransferase [Brucella pituitosa]